MNYQLVYDRIMARAVFRYIPGYKEKHHIVPKCLGGSDDKKNIVKLTPREHFIAHQLLVKIHPNVTGLWYGVFMMSKKGAIQNHRSRDYEWLRRGYSKSQSKRMKENPRDKQTWEAMHAAGKGRKVSDKQKQYLRSLYLGKSLPEETRKKISDGLKGKTRTPEQRASQSARMKGKVKPWFIGNKSRTGMKNSPQMCAKIAASNTGKKHSEQWKRNITLGNSKIPHDIILNVRADYQKGGISQDKLANKYSLSQSQISRIVRGVMYSWVKAA